MMVGKLYKQGGSVVLAIPKSYLHSLGWSPGTVIAIYLISEEGLNLKTAPLEPHFSSVKPFSCPKKGGS